MTRPHHDDTAAAPAGARFRLIEDPLGPATLERPSPEEVRAVWDEALKLPVPDYAGLTLRRAFRP